MTNEMIERVARAIFHSQRGSTARATAAWELASDSQKYGYRSDARAAIQALREPNEAMIDAGYCEAPTDINELIEYWNTLSPEDIWPAMIDAILKEHP